MARTREQGPRRAVGEGELVSQPVQRGQVFWQRERRSGGLEDDGESPGEVPDDGKRRPLLVVSRDDLNRGNAVQVVPFYSQQLDKRRKQKSCVFFAAGEAGLPKDCVAKCDEMGSIDKIHLDFSEGQLGRVEAPKMKQVVDAIRYCIRDDTLSSQSRPATAKAKSEPAGGEPV
jgi:mRNA-degrading endonuclease toxin of MazEF toxin-antitoxin module